MGLRADGPPGRWKKNNIRNKKKQEAERRKEEAERKNILKVRKQEGRQERRQAGQQAGRQAGQQEGQQEGLATFIFHWKLFPSCDTVRLKYKTKNNNINLCVFNILYE